MERQPRVDAIAERVQALQRRDARVEYSIAALRIHILRRITGHRRDDLNLMFREKARVILVAGLEQDGEVAAIDDMPGRRECFQALHKIFEVRNHLRRAAGQIDRRNVRLSQPVDEPVDGRPRHDFLPLRSGIHVAMNAGKIAKLADIDLKHLRLRMPQRQIVLRQLAGETVVGREVHLQQQAPPSQHCDASVVTL
jgi:hypothetical protein